MSIRATGARTPHGENGVLDQLTGEGRRLLDSYERAGPSGVEVEPPSFSVHIVTTRHVTTEQSPLTIRECSPRHYRRTNVRSAALVRILSSFTGRRMPAADRVVSGTA